jgi:hypothetical protein
MWGQPVSLAHPYRNYRDGNKGLLVETKAIAHLAELF